MSIVRKRVYDDGNRKQGVCRRQEGGVMIQQTGLFLSTDHVNSDAAAISWRVHFDNTLKAVYLSKIFNYC